MRDGVRRRPSGGEVLQLVAIGEIHGCRRGVAEAGCPFGDRLQHGQHVGRRARDHAQDFRDRRLLLQRFLRLVEQPHVVDRDRGLIGERLHERDLLLGEQPRLHPPQLDGADRPILAEQRHRQRGVMPDASLQLAADREVVLRSGSEVFDLYGCAVYDCPARNRTASQGYLLVHLHVRRAAERGSAAK